MNENVESSRSTTISADSDLMDLSSSELGTQTQFGAVMGGCGCSAGCGCGCCGCGGSPGGAFCTS